MSSETSVVQMKLMSITHERPILDTVMHVFATG